MKKIFGILLVVSLLVLSMSFAAFAEETEVTLADEIQALEETIAGYEALLVSEDPVLNDEERALTEALLADAQAQLDLLVLAYDAEQEVSREEEILTLQEDLNIALAALEATDTEAYTEEELLAYQAEIDAIKAEFESLQAEYDALTAPTFDEQVAEATAAIEAINDNIATLEASLEDETLTPEEIAAIEAEINTAKEDLANAEASLETLVAENAAEEAAAIEAEINDLNALIAEYEAALESVELTDVEIAELEALIADANTQIEALEAQLDNAVEESKNPNTERFMNAEKYNVTPGKMNLLERLHEASENEEFDYGVWADMSVKDIMAEMKAYRKGTHETEDESEGVELEVKAEKEHKDKSHGKGKKK